MIIGIRWPGKLAIARLSAFLPYDQRCDLIYAVIKPGYAKVRSGLETK